MRNAYTSWLSTNNDFNRDHMTSKEFDEFLEKLCLEFEEYKTYLIVTNITGQKKD